MLVDWAHPGGKHLRDASFWATLVGFVTSFLCAVFLRSYGTDARWGMELFEDWTIAASVTGVSCLLLYRATESAWPRLSVLAYVGTFASAVVYFGMVMTATFVDVPLSECSMRSSLTGDNLGVAQSGLLLASSVVASALTLGSLFGLWVACIALKDSDSLHCAHSGLGSAAQRQLSRYASLALTVLLVAQLWMFGTGTSLLMNDLGHPNCYYLHDDNPAPAEVSVGYVHTVCAHEDVAASGQLHKLIKLCVTRRLDSGCASCAGGYWGRMSIYLVDLLHKLVGRTFGARHALVLLTFCVMSAVVIVLGYLALRTDFVDSQSARTSDNRAANFRKASIRDAKHIGCVTAQDIAPLADELLQSARTATADAAETAVASVVQKSLVLVSAVMAQQLQSEVGFCVAYVALVAARLLSTVCVAAAAAIFLRVDWATPFAPLCADLVEGLDGFKAPVVQLIVAECVCWASLVALPAIAKAHAVRAQQQSNNTPNKTH